MTYRFAVGELSKIISIELKKHCKVFVGCVVEWLEHRDGHNMISVQNLLASFCCVLEKETIGHFPLLGGPGKQF